MKTLAKMVAILGLAVISYFIGVEGGKDQERVAAVEAGVGQWTLDEAGRLTGFEFTGVPNER